MILGVDPGASGALALLCPLQGLVEVVDFPVLKIKGKSTIDLYALGRWLAGHADEIQGACVEQVGAMPQQGVSSVWSFGFATGALHGALAAHQIPLELVTPAKWKKAFRLGQDKDASRQLASRTWPKSSHLFARVKDDGRAEAALIAKWCLDQKVRPDDWREW